MSAIACEGLTKVYGGRPVVDGVTFAVEHGEVVGFLGPNGAGKTTTLRLLLGLATPDAGRATVLGQRYAELPQPARRVAAVLDEDGLHPGRSGLAQLRIAARGIGAGDDLVAWALERVELGEVAGHRIRTYSLGMRRRLALACALLGDPELLILDEPANGLDPAGVRWLRGLLRGLAADGRAVLISSHVLAEVAQTVDRVVVLHQGRVRAAAPVAELSGDRTLEDVFLALTDADAPAAEGFPGAAAQAPVARRPAPAAAPVSDRDERAVATSLQALAAAALRAPAAADLDEPRRHGERGAAPLLVAVAGMKGGIGRTTISLLLADMLASANAARVAVVDCDPACGTLAEAVGGQTVPALPELADRAANVPDAARTAGFAKRLPSGVDVFGLAAGELPSALGPEQYEQVLDLLRRHYEIVVCDLPASPAAPVAAHVLARADRTLVVTSGERLARDRAMARRGFDRHLLVVNRVQGDAGALVTMPEDPQLGAAVAEQRYRHDAIAARTRAAGERLAATVLDGEAFAQANGRRAVSAPQDAATELREVRS